MRAKSREINVFGLSMLDVMCGALGAFMLLFMSVISQERAASTPLDEEERRELEELREENPRLEEERNAAEKERDQLQSMSISIDWLTPDADVDLWVRNAEGQWYGPKVEFRKGIKSAYRNPDGFNDRSWEALTITSVNQGTWHVGVRVQSRAFPGQSIFVNGVLFANLSTDYQVVWSMGDIAPTQDGKLYAFMRFVIEDGKLRNEPLTPELREKLEDEFNSLGSGPPEVLWLPGEREKLAKEQRSGS